MKQFFKKPCLFGIDFKARNNTVFHITHYKAGSQWIYAVLTQLGEENVIPPEIAAAHYTRGGILPGRIYPCIYLTKQQFDVVKRPWRSKCFVVIRDLRDTLVSQYFSVKSSHEIMFPQMQRTRNRLNAMSLSEGLTLMLNNNVYISADIQKSWIGEKKILLIKYEDLIADEHAVFKKIFKYCRLDSDEVDINRAIEMHSFERTTGRKPGQEDINSHHRKGIAGDWENYFDDRLKDAFKEKYAQLLIDSGYEKDDHW